MIECLVKENPKTCVKHLAPLEGQVCGRASPAAYCRCGKGANLRLGVEGVLAGPRTMDWGSVQGTFAIAETRGCPLSAADWSRDIRWRETWKVA